MSVLELIFIFLVLTATLAYLNKKYLKLPDTIGLMVLSMLMSLCIVGIHNIHASWFENTIKTINQIDFTTLLFDGMLSFMLFAGAFHTNVDEILEEKLSISVLALIGVVICTYLVGGMMYIVFQWLHYPLPFILCLLFGALISPTDPIAVLGILQEYNAPNKLEITLIGESLFNDGVGVVVFATIIQIIKSGTMTVGDISMLFLQEAVGGIVFGLLLGYFLFKILKSIDHYQTEVMITLAGVAGGYLIAKQLHISAPLAMVVAGLFVGRRARGIAMSDLTEEYLDKFWEMLDVLLNSILFVLIGLKILAIETAPTYWKGAIIMVGVVLIARFISVFLPYIFIRKKANMPSYTPLLLTWGGLRGGISIALALSISNTIEHKDLLVFITYFIVVFSIIGQGLSLGVGIKKLTK